MQKQILILEIGGEGGSIKLIQIGSLFFFTANEIAMNDFLPGEFNINDLKNTSPAYESFDQSMESLIKKYPVFYLYPLYVHPEYQQRIKEYFIRHLDKQDNLYFFEASEWKSILNLK